MIAIPATSNGSKVTTTLAGIAVEDVVTYRYIDTTVGNDMN